MTPALGVEHRRGSLSGAAYARGLRVLARVAEDLSLPASKLTAAQQALAATGLLDFFAAFAPACSSGPPWNENRGGSTKRADPPGGDLRIRHHDKWRGALFTLLEAACLPPYAGGNNICDLHSTGWHATESRGAAR